MVRAGKTREESEVDLFSKGAGYIFIFLGAVAVISMIVLFLADLLLN
jgi:hypothetical protein